LGAAGRPWLWQDAQRAEWVRESVRDGRFQYVNLIGATVDDARDIMIEGESGILAVCPRWERPRYLKSERKLSWPNGATSR
jgi:phage terminase large subunit-like protein